MPYRDADQLNTYLFHEGTAISAYEFMGAHATTRDGVSGYMFRVWAPRALAVSVVGDFNFWDVNAHPMEKITDGIWECFLPGGQPYDAYKFAVTGADGVLRYKADPYAFHAETRPGTSSKLYTIDGYQWGDGAWLEHRHSHQVYSAPLNIYEVHLGSWRRRENGDFIDYRDLARQLAPLCQGAWLQLCRAAAHHRVPPGRQLGLPVHRLLRTHLPVRDAGGLPASSWTTCTSRASGSSWTGSPPTSARTSTACTSSTAPGAMSTRTCARASTPLGHPGVRLRPAGGEELPPLLRGLLAEGVPHRRHPGGRGGLHAVPGLRPARRPVGGQQVRRQGAPGGHRLPAGAEQDRLYRQPRRADGGGGVHRLAPGDQARRGGRPGLQPEVEHGLDERHVPLPEDGPLVPPGQPQGHHLLHVVRLLGELCPAPCATTRWST